MFQFYICFPHDHHKLVKRLAITCVLVCLSSMVGAKSLPVLQLANVYSSEVNVEDYWVSEKLDGVRAYWDGKQFLSKNGNRYHAPAWFTKKMPDFALDGELWMARNTFDVLSGIVRQKIPVDSEWRKVSYHVFDLPQHPAIFDIRLQVLNTFFAEGEVSRKDLGATPLPVWLKLVQQVKVKTHVELMAQLDHVIKLGGEGLMLHLGASIYHGRRNNDLLKLKRYFDAEATVIEHFPGKGKYIGMLGALLVETNGRGGEKIRFRIGSGFSDQERKNPPALGSEVTYKYFGFTQSGLPKFPSYQRVRY